MVGADMNKNTVVTITLNLHVIRSLVTGVGLLMNKYIHKNNKRFTLRVTSCVFFHTKCRYCHLPLQTLIFTILVPKAKGSIYIACLTD